MAHLVITGRTKHPVSIPKHIPADPPARRCTQKRIFFAAVLQLFIIWLQPSAAGTDDIFRLHRASPFQEYPPWGMCHKHLLCVCTFSYFPVQFPPLGFANQPFLKQYLIEIVQPNFFGFLACIGFHPAQPLSIVFGASLLFYVLVDPCIIFNT